MFSTSEALYILFNMSAPCFQFVVAKYGWLWLSSSHDYFSRKNNQHYFLWFLVLQWFVWGLMKVQHHAEAVVRWWVSHLFTVPKYFGRICLDYVFLSTFGRKNKMRVCIHTMSSFFSLFKHFFFFLLCKTASHINQAA